MTLALLEANDGEGTARDRDEGLKKPMRDQGENVPGRLSRDSCEDDWIYDRYLETASAETILKISNRAWSKQATSLTDRSAFYHRKFADERVSLADAPAVTDLQRLPFTTKQELKNDQEAHPPFGRYLAVPVEQVKRAYQTSGTTGRPSLLALTESDLHEVWGRIGLRSYYGSGFHAHSAVATNFGAGPFVAGTVHRVFERIGCRTVPVDPRDTERLVHALELKIIDSLLATPSYVLYLASLFEKEGVDAHDFGLVHINVGGEPGAGIPGVKTRIEETFGAQLTEVMGLGDISPSLYGECPVGGGMHFCGQGLVWVELIDPQSGESINLEPGARGEPVYTHLRRDAMPLVRFRSGDFVEVQQAGCPCGRSSFRIRCVGRVDDMIIVRGVNVYPSAVQSVVADFRPRVTGRSRLVVEGGGVAVDPPVPVEVEVSQDEPRESSRLAQEITAAIREKLVFRAEIRLVPESEFGAAGYKTRGLIRSSAQG